MASFPRGFSPGLGPRRLRRANLVSHLLSRELGGHSAPVVGGNSHLTRARQAYWSIYPTRALNDVRVGIEGGEAVVRKFSPCGKFLLCFSQSLHAVALFCYLGPQGSGDTFESYFKFSSETSLTSGNEMLCKDFSMFTSDKRFAILASAVPTSTPATAPGSLNCLQSLDDVTFHTLDLFTGKISDKWTFKSDFIYLSHQAGVHLYEDLLAVVSVQNQTIHVLRIDSAGKFHAHATCGYFLRPDDADVLQRASEEAEEFKLAQRQKKRGRDSEPGSPLKKRLVESHGQGISSATVQGSEGGDFGDSRPTARLLWPPRIEGSMLDSSRSTGPATDVEQPPPEGAATTSRWSSSWTTANGNRVTLLSTTGAGAGGSDSEQARLLALPGSPTDHASPAMLPLLKQRILSFLCRRAMSTGLARRKLYFHLASGMFSKLAMWRCMFLDRSRLLLKFGAEEQVTGRTDPPPGSQAFFVLYNLETTLVEGVWDSASEELLVLYERCHAFRGPQFVEEPWHPAQGVVENPWAREAASKGMHAVGKAKNGGVLASIRRLLSALPHNPQSHSTSAYLDLSLFSYTHPLSTFERPILLPDHPLRFWNRATGEKVFELDLGQGRRWGSLVWHPVEPLCFSVVVGNGGTTVNLHVR